MLIIVSLPRDPTCSHWCWEWSKKIGSKMKFWSWITIHVARQLAKDTITGDDRTETEHKLAVQWLKVPLLVNWVVIQWKRMQMLANFFFFFTGPDSISYSALMFLFYNSLKIGHDKNRQTQEWVWPASHSLPNPEL